MRRRILLVMLAVTALAPLVPSAAMASPSPGYEEFSECPDKGVDDEIEACLITTVTGGHLQIGSKNTPIEDPITLVTATSEDTAYVGHFDGGRQRIPGGLIGITGLDWLTFLFPFDLLKLYAEPELAGPITGGDAIGLPLKLHLDNPLLAPTCYVGSDSNPVQLNLTTGTTNPPPPNQPITGQDGTATPDPVLPGVIRSTGIIFVDNEFAAPAASGCDLLFFGLINALVNTQAGLPSPAGTNETVQETEATIGFIRAIYQPDGFEQ
jgi:hypothetical protein